MSKVPPTKALPPLSPHYSHTNDAEPLSLPTPSSAIPTASENLDRTFPSVVDRKVKWLLKRLNMDNFELISNQIVDWANEAEAERDARTLIQVIRLIFIAVTQNEASAEMYARLCRRMMERISAQVKDEGIKTHEGKPIAGGNLFRKYLLDRCQEDFEKNWSVEGSSGSATASDAAINSTAKETTPQHSNEETPVRSELHYAAQRARRRGLALIRFIGELFKLQMLTERIMHECVQRLLRNVDNPEEEEIESLCKLLSTIGSTLDSNQRARTHMDVYFTRIKELSKASNVSPQIQLMLQDVLESREKKWLTRNPGEEQAAGQNRGFERGGPHRGGSQRGRFQGGQGRGEAGAGGWTVQRGSAPTKIPAKAGDLSQFGRIGFSKRSPITNFGPSSVFNRKDSNWESNSRTSSNARMFHVLQSSENALDPSAPTCTTAQEAMILQPHARMLAADAKRKLDEDLKEFKVLRHLDEGEEYFRALPPVHHALLVDKFVSWAVESRETDAQLVADLFARAASKPLCTSSSFEAGFSVIAEFIGDTAIDAPKAPNYFATIVKATGLGEEERTRIVEKSPDYREQLRRLLL